LILSNGSNQTYVVFGSCEGFAATLDVSSLNGVNGFTIFLGVLAMTSSTLALAMM